MKTICIENIRFFGVCRKCIFSFNFTDRTKFMILFHLQRLGSQRRELRCFNFWKIKCRKKVYIFFKILRFCAIVCVFFLMKTDVKLHLRCRQLNSIQNDMCFNHLGQKLWEKIHFLQPKVYFSGEGKTHQYELCVKSIT